MKNYPLHKTLGSSPRVGSSHLSLIACSAMLVSVSAASAAVINTSSFGTDPSDYTLTRILNNGTGTNNSAPVIDSGNISFTATTQTAGSTVFQYAYIFNGLSLAVGDELKADVESFSTTMGNNSSIGLYVGKTPTTDVREDYVASYLGATGNGTDYTIRNRGFNGSTEFGSSTATGSNPVATALFIARTSTTSFDVGYYNGSGTRTVVISRTGLSTDNDASAVGFFLDSRAAGSIGSLVVPEPSSTALLGLGLMAGLAFRRRHV